VGSRLAQFTTQFDDRYIRSGTAIVQIDLEARDIGRYYPVAVGIHADARETCQALLAALAQGGGPARNDSWLREAETLPAQPGARDRGTARHRGRDDRDEQQLLGIGEGLSEALLWRALHRL